VKRTNDLWNRGHEQNRLPGLGFAGPMEWSAVSGLRLSRPNGSADVGMLRFSLPHSAACFSVCVSYACRCMGNAMSIEEVSMEFAKVAVNRGRA
jgi:hypothetical protein